MDFPEYLSLFRNNGEFKVSVQCKGFDGFVGDLSMHADEIGKLIDPHQNTFYQKLYFDDHLCEVIKYEINPIKKTVKIKIRTEFEL